MVLQTSTVFACLSFTQNAVPSKFSPRKLLHILGTQPQCSMMKAPFTPQMYIPPGSAALCTTSSPALTVLHGGVSFTSLQPLLGSSEAGLRFYFSSVSRT